MRTVGEKSWTVESSDGRGKIVEASGRWVHQLQPKMYADGGGIKKRLSEPIIPVSFIQPVTLEEVTYGP